MTRMAHVRHEAVFAVRLPSSSLYGWAFARAFVLSGLRWVLLARNGQRQACVIAEYTCQVVPGLLQTADFTRALYKMHYPRHTEDAIEEAVNRRMSRQAVFRRDNPPEYSAILDEAVLHRGFGGPAVMRAQLARLIELMLTSAGVVQVLPFAYGGHPLVGGSGAVHPGRRHSSGLGREL